MDFFEKRTGGKTIYNGKILKLISDDVLLPDGSSSKREIVRHSGGAAVLLVTDNKVLLVRQYRYAYGKEIYEIPAGKLDGNEDPAEGAARELKEEAGYAAELEHLIDIYPSPGYTDEIIHLYYAKSPRFVGQKLDEGEFLNCEFIPLERVIKMIEAGEINDAKTVTALYAYLLKTKK